jgi:LmbE family N-acetylglucosaminyl deacetylase
MDAVYPFSRDRNFFIEHTQEGLHPHTVKAILFTGAPEQVNTKIDITKVVSIKKKGMREHTSQFNKKTIEEILEHFKDGKRDVERGFYIKLR